MPLRRIAIVAGIVVALALAVFGVTRLQQKVEVTTGTRIVCTYGHPISEDVRTISVRPADASKYGVKTVTKTCAKHAQAEKLYREAQAALQKGDVNRARAKLTEVAKLDKDFASTQQQLETIVNGKKPQPDTEGAAPVVDNKPKPEPGDGGAVALTAWTPSAISGFTAQRPLVEAMAVTRQYFPDGESDIVQLVIVAEQFKTSIGAKAALQAEVKSKYTANKASITVGDHAAYYATDGNRFAVIGFTDGAVLVAVEIGAKPEQDPNSFKGALIDIVKQLP